jgi:hypothetical protein
MPEIHDIHPLGPLEDVSTVQAREWTKLDSPGKILARPFNPLVHAQRYHDEIANDLLTAIKEITDAPRVSIGKPTRGPQVQDNPRFPMAFLIHDISANDAELLTGRKVWAGPNITFEAITFPPPRPTYLFTLRGLATSSEENIKNIVLDTWKDSISFAFFDKIVANSPAQFTIPLSQEIISFVDSIQIKPVDIKQEGGRDDPHFNIYTQSSALSSAEIWMDICTFFRSRNYISSTLGCGHVTPDAFYCPVCHGKDHPRGLCPFPKLPGWKEATTPPRNEYEQPRERPPRARRSFPYNEPPRGKRFPTRGGGYRTRPY